MAIPIITSAQDCANYSRVVESYIPQFYELPHRLIDIFTKTDAESSILSRLADLYIETNPLISSFSASLAIALIVLVVSEYHQNFSQIDRLWSILPNLYVLHHSLWARMYGIPHERVDLMCLATTFWSVRLTYNYWRKGGYQRGSEDYRWEIVQSQMPRFAFFLLNVVYISFLQSILLWAMSAVPAYVIMLAGTEDVFIHGGDLSYFVICLGLVGLEYISDNQQWVYQNAKKHYKATGEVVGGFKETDLQRGFITTGLFKYIRHPNFIGEQLFWYTLYSWTCLASQSYILWAFTGSFSLIVLFQASTSLTESITASKYPEYKVYQSQVGMFFPTSFSGFTQPAPKIPKIIRTSELEKRWNDKQKEGVKNE